MEGKKEVANDDWKNESLKSSLKFVSNENSQDQIMAPNLIPMPGGSMRNSKEMQQIEWRSSQRRES